ncbi:MAG: hypothetical protein JRD94_14000, partial [Deltaproteobacteria bacterium]|nr:hypothetical protein [Deltaproteobacteria bacterium]
EVVRHLEAAEQPVQLASQRLGIETHLVIAGESAQATLDAIPEDTEAIYIGPFFKWSDDEMQILVDGINAQDLPSYAGGGVKWVERGALATMETEEDEIRRMRRAAIFVQRIYSRSRLSNGRCSSSTWRPPKRSGPGHALRSWPKRE